ncbi:MAG: protease HtpX [Gammaproteobacteria bacterium]|nr:protease HtpX [Gammaproteobacteria bacterium]MDH3449799.1 protease HtpX [Gammaproteobacteria bacterium]
MFSRLVLFLLANFGVLAVLSLSMRVLGVDAYLASQGGVFQLNGLLLMAAIMGFAGSFISLAMSKMMAKRSMRVRVIEAPRNEVENWLVAVVRRQASQAGIGMPEVGIFDSPTMNAFATGMNRDDALVAVSTGLLSKMSRDEVEAVLGHEVSHVANGDMVTMGLLQGVLNTFVIFFSRLIGILVDRVVFRIERGIGPGYWIGSIVAEIILGIVAAIIASWFSRRREYRADAGGAALAGRGKMVAALERLRRAHDQPDLPGEMAAFGIIGGSALKALLSTHPPLEKRIAQLMASSAA